MQTYRYCIEQIDDCYHVTEANGPNAPATGYYPTLEAAQDAVLTFSGLVDITWEHGRDEDINWWLAEWENAQ